MTVFEFLRQPQKLDLQIRNKLIERQQYQDIAMGITASMDGGRVSASGSKSKMADAVDRLVDIEAEVNTLVDRLIDTKREVINVIEKVENPIWYDILHMKYIQYKTLQEIADHYHKDYDWAKTNMRKARGEVQMIMEKEEGER